MELKDKTFLLIGGTGSFGTGFLQILLNEICPKTVRIFSRDEYKQKIIAEQYDELGKKCNLTMFVGDVRDKERLQRAMEGVDIVIHAAALKQVQSCEYNPMETIKTNIIGSTNIIEAALDNNVDKVIAISSDKAVQPINLYGATKMCMEKLIVNANNYRGKTKRTKFCCARYGNVIGSRGSVIPLWKEKIFNKKPIPITSPNATRFWMKLKDANKFVIDCLDLMETLSGGEIFVPDLCSSTIIDLLHAVAGTTSYQFEIMGNRIGDKLHETLLTEEETQHATKIKNIYVIYPRNAMWKYTIPFGEKVYFSNGSYNSENAKRFTVEELKRALEEN